MPLCEPRSRRSHPKPISTTLAPDEDLQEALDLDSMDFLNFLIAIAQSTGFEIPESDYHLVRSFADCKDYLAHRSS